MLKKTILTTAGALIVTMMTATFIERFRGTDYVGEQIYGSWWFVALWAVMAIASLAYSLRRKLHKRLAVMMLHISFVVILAGALTTFLTARRGKVHLRQGIPTNTYSHDDGRSELLPFTLELTKFNIEYYPGTDAPMDYASVIESGGETISVSMNSIGSIQGYRFFQSGYDEDMQGTYLGMAYDPWGIGVTYAGYFLLFLSIACIMLSRKTRIRQLLHDATKPFIILFLLIPSTSFASTANEEKEAEIASEMGRLCVLYNGRICPVNTLATDFLTKLSGRASWNGHSADEVFCGWILHPTKWEKEKLIRIKDSSVRDILGIEDQWASFDDFWDNQNRYKLEKPLRMAMLEGDAATKKRLSDADEKFNIIRMLYGGELMHIFPYTANGRLTWYSPVATELPENMKVEEWNFIRKAIERMTECVASGDYQGAMNIVRKIGEYQQKRGNEVSGVIPSRFAVSMEILLNRLTSMKWLTFCLLTISMLLMIAITTRGNLATSSNPRSKTMILQYAVAVIIATYLSILLAMRWYVSRHMPLSNGYETMIFMAWAVVILTLLLSTRMRILIAFGPFLSSICMLVATIGGQNPQITQLMPVLQSPLLSTHVMVIMFAYSLFALQMMIGITALFKRREAEQVAHLTATSQLLLYPAVFLLTIGIFIGAIWANVSWGRYWGWDSKEVWALITMLIYALPFHQESVRFLRSPLRYHTYMVLAFLSVLFTYFGVNYLLTGMHSYA